MVQETREGGGDAAAYAGARGVREAASGKAEPARILMAVGSVAFLSSAKMGRPLKSPPLNSSSPCALAFRNPPARKRGKEGGDRNVEGASRHLLYARSKFSRPRTMTQPLVLSLKISTRSTEHTVRTWSFSCCQEVCQGSCGHRPVSAPTSFFFRPNGVRAASYVRWLGECSTAPSGLPGAHRPGMCC